MQSFQRASYFNILGSMGAALSAQELCEWHSDSAKGLLAAAVMLLSCRLMVTDIYEHLCKRPLSLYEKKVSGVTGMMVAMAAWGSLLCNIENPQPELPTFQNHDSSTLAFRL